MGISHAVPERTGTKERAPASFEALFSYGFRPFFLGAAIYAALFMSVWLIWIATSGASLSQDWLPVTGTPFAWHAHEMVFGFAAAALAGFLLTAVPNWTGALPISGTPLVVLFLTWLAGRLVMGTGALLPSWFAAGVDLAFLPLLGATAARQLMIKPALRNLVFLAILAAMTAANLAFHLANFEVIAWNPLTPMRVSLLLVAVMIAIIGGRIIPAFTHNWLHLEGLNRAMPRRYTWLDALSVLSIVVVACTFAAGISGPLRAAAGLTATILNGARLLLWRPLSTWREPIVWVLHLGYAWLVIALALTAVGALTNALPESLALHAFGTGAAGTMILAVMSRASLGHTGRPLTAARPTVWSYAFVSIAALLRVLGPLLMPDHTSAVLTAAASAWIAAFAIFAAVYAPILTTRRVHMRMAAS